MEEQEKLNLKNYENGQERRIYQAYSLQPKDERVDKNTSTHFQCWDRHNL
jgi:hypothetical protein